MTPLLLALLLVPVSQDSGSRSVVEADPAPRERAWTVLVYGAADNNADGPLFECLDGIRETLGEAKDVSLVLWVDRSKEYSEDSHGLGEDFTGGRLFELRPHDALRLDGGEEFPEGALDADTEPNSADASLLGRFVLWGKTHYPARHTALLIYSHADGRAMCPDEECGREMGIAELTERVSEDASVDLLALELCNMCGVEIAYQWRPGNGGFSCDYLVAIPNAGPPLDWGRVFRAFEPATMAPADFGRLVVEKGEEGRRALAEQSPRFAERLAHEAAACLDLEAVELVKEAVDRWAIALSESGAKELFEEIRGPGPDGSLSLHYGGDDVLHSPYFDLYALARRTAEDERFDESVREAAGEVGEATDALVLASFGMPGLRGFEPGRSGVFLVFPDGDAPLPGLPGDRAWKGMRWYSPLEVEPRFGVHGRWAWCEDGATPADGVVQNWFEMLDAWFDDTRSGPFGVNGYRW